MLCEYFQTISSILIQMFPNGCFLINNDLVHFPSYFTSSNTCGVYFGGTINVAAGEFLLSFTQGGNILTSLPVL